MSNNYPLPKIVFSKQRWKQLYRMQQFSENDESKLDHLFYQDL